MKWYSADIEPEKGRWVIYCMLSERGVQFECARNQEKVPTDIWWTYEDELTHKDIFKNSHDEPGKFTLPQYTGKR